MSSTEMLVLVDDHDHELGTDTRENCHRGTGKRHRAYTVFLFHDGKVLLQRRSQKKLLWPGAWDVSYTSHVYPGETYQQAAERKARQELGASIGELEDVNSFVYFAPQGGNAENEFCRILVGDFDGRVVPNPEEMAEIRWASLEDLERDVKANPDSYTPWFKLSFDGFLKHPSSAKHR